MGFKGLIITIKGKYTASVLSSANTENELPCLILRKGM
jgi:hypothetical protein